jgi:hypothetical protein
MQAIPEVRLSSATLGFKSTLRESCGEASVVDQHRRPSPINASAYLELIIYPNNHRRIGFKAQCRVFAKVAKPHHRVPLPGKQKNITNLDLLEIFCHDRP